MPQHTVIVNESALRDIVNSRRAVLGSLDAKRPQAWEQYGYPQEVTFSQLWLAYSRGGAGHGAIHLILDKCWQENPRIKQPQADKETPWEVKVNKLFTDINAWAKLRDFDRRNMVGRYAGLIYRMGDGKALDQPLAKASKLVDLVPVYEDQLQVETWNTDQSSEAFGQPVMWKYRMRRPGTADTQAQPDAWVNVHPSRIQILAEGSVGDFLDGVPLLKAGFNHLVDLEKVAGGSAESFLKNSARSVVFRFDANSNPQAIALNEDGTPSGKSVGTVLEEKTEALNKNIDASIALQGGEATTLQTTVSDPMPSFLVAANLFSASVQVANTLIFGQQTGRLASDEDKVSLAARCKSRQRTELTPMLTESVRRLQAAGLIDQGEFEIEWPALDAPGETDKLDNAGKMANINKTSLDAGQPGVFDGNEIRKVAGFEERDELKGIPLEGDPLEGDPAADQAADPAAAPASGPMPAPAPRAPRLAA